MSGVKERQARDGTRTAARLAGITGLAVAALLCANGCGSDTTKPAPPTGTIVIDPAPHTAGIGWPWKLAGAETTYGYGPATLADMPPGDYTMIWIDEAGWCTPASSTRTLFADSTLSFRGIYFNSGVLVSAGSFTMGSPTDEQGRLADESQHAVTLTQAFYISQWEVTEELWDDVMASGTSVSQLPKIGISWDTAVAFCNTLSEQQGMTPAYTIRDVNGDVTWDRDADGYRLPTEAEWEYACRAGSQTAFANGPISVLACHPDANLDQMGWHCGNSDHARHDVGQKLPNAWGLYDMHGNVDEYVWDGYRGDYQNLGSVDPVCEVGVSEARVYRGGDWLMGPRACRSACRCSGFLYGVYPNAIHSNAGLRVVRSAI